MNSPLILDFDQSVGHIEHAKTLNLTTWQEQIRFGCTKKIFNKLECYLQPQLPKNYGTVLMGSGDYHHLSLLLIKQLADRYSAKNPIEVIIFDNHPDNMRYLFGIHCGSWVSHLARLPFVSHIHVVGITSSDISLYHLWENRLAPLLKKRLTYWSMGINTAPMQKLGLGESFRNFSSADELIASFLAEQYYNQKPIYLSIDKDALSEKVIHTNWDQGELQTYHLLDTITAIKPRIIGSDITGELSIWHPKSRFKRLLTLLDKQPNISQATLKQWQQEQHELNLTLLDALKS
ncbi:arginase family protein [Orbaceae bacterium ESL0721]|nr:arginase family protein [Orbaceae bacterium ESL0721]